ncbi:MAG: 3'-5' exonuclease [Proteobacteria bacterium]|nr:3'-5' exonuclease [Pseudomonadota bacterium]
MEIGLIVDVETTGLDPVQDQVIEIGLCEFGWSEVMPPTVTRMYGALQDPQCPVSKEISTLTGLTDTVLKGQSIDWALVSKIWNGATVIVAHNAEFDRGFLSRISALQGQPKHWGCSVRHIDWRAKGFGTRKLQYLAADHGFVNPFAHRALFDCMTTYRLVRPHLAELLKRSHEPEIKFLAVGSPFESKDVLKASGYHWASEQRVWHKTVSPDQVNIEREFLGQQVYRGAPKHIEETIWFNSKQY